LFLHATTPAVPEPVNGSSGMWYAFSRGSNGSVYAWNNCRYPGEHKISFYKKLSAIYKENYIFFDTVSNHYNVYIF
jgi:hypothetical protein